MISPIICESLYYFVYYLYLCILYLLEVGPILPLPRLLLTPALLVKIMM